jgi:hypothetical protein
MKRKALRATVVKPIRNWKSILHEIGKIVEVRHWSEVLGTCTVMDDDGVDCQTGVPIEKLELLKK